MVAYRSTNPARIKEIIATVELGGPEAVVDACRAARAAQPAWADVPAPVRGRALGHAGRIVEANAEALARLVTAEVGKPYAETDVLKLGKAFQDATDFHRRAPDLSSLGL